MAAWKHDRREPRSTFEPLSPGSDSRRSSPFRDRRIAVFRFVLLGLAAWTINSLVLSDHGLLHLRELRAEEAAKDGAREMLNAKIDGLEREVEESKQDRQERMAREKYRQSRSDEILYLFDRKTPAARASSDSSRAPVDEGE